MKRLALIVLAVAALAACATKPPAPPECEGEFVPINAAVSAAAAGSDREARPSR